MKDKSKSNRGKPLEELIRLANDRYRADGTAIVVKVPTEFIPLRNGYGKLVGCKVENKSSVDFIGRYGNYPIAFEAKNTNTDRISLSEVQPHQEDFLDKWGHLYNGRAFVVVAFNQMTEFYNVPWTYWSEALKAWRTDKGSKRKVNLNWQELETPGRASLKPSDMLPEWKIETGGKYALDYLMAEKDRE